MTEISRAAILETAKDVKEHFELIWAGSKPRIRHLRDNVAVCLITTILEQYCALLAVLREGMTSHAFNHLRGMLESFADLMNILRDAEYLQQLKFEDASNQLVMYRALEENCDATQSFPVSLEHIASWIVFYESVITESKAKGCKRQTIKDKLNKAGHLKLYKLYQILCSHTHNQLATLFERHQDNITFYYKRPDETDEPIKACLDLAVAILCDSFGQYLKLTQWTEVDIRIMVGHIAKGWRAGDLHSES